MLTISLIVAGIVFGGLVAVAIRRQNARDTALENRVIAVRDELCHWAATNRECAIWHSYEMTKEGERVLDFYWYAPERPQSILKLVFTPSDIIDQADIGVRVVRLGRLVETHKYGEVDQLVFGWGKELREFVLERKKRAVRSA